MRLLRRIRYAYSKKKYYINDKKVNLFVLILVLILCVFACSLIQPNIYITAASCALR